MSMQFLVAQTQLKAQVAAMADQLVMLAEQLREMALRLDALEKQPEPRKPGRPRLEMANVV